MEKELTLPCNCANEMHTCDMGSCQNCGENTASGEMKLCAKCADEMECCQFCGAKAIAPSEKDLPSK